ncbi:MAG: hypothetical protein ACK2UT_05765 [Candidatus Promineifilaceae bacterium]|jgi:hypothetical protein
METVFGKVLIVGILFLFTLVSGVIVSRSGRPLNIWLVTVHKLAAVGTVVLIYMAVHQAYKTADGRVFIMIGLAALSAVFFVALIASGAFLTREEMELPAFVLRIHQLAPLMALLSTSLTLVLLLQNQGSMLLER